MAEQQRIIRKLNEARECAYLLTSSMEAELGWNEPGADVAIPNRITALLDAIHEVEVTSRPGYLIWATSYREMRVELIGLSRIWYGGTRADRRIAYNIALRVYARIAGLVDGIRIGWQPFPEAHDTEDQTDSLIEAIIADPSVLDSQDSD